MNKLRKQWTLHKELEPCLTDEVFPICQDTQYFMGLSFGAEKFALSIGHFNDKGNVVLDCGGMFERERFYNQQRFFLTEVLRRYPNMTCISDTSLSTEVKADPLFESCICSNDFIVWDRHLKELILGGDILIPRVPGAEVIHELLKVRNQEPTWRFYKAPHLVLLNALGGMTWAMHTANPLSFL